MKLYVATPCYGGMMYDAYAQGILQLQHDVNAHGGTFMFQTLRNESLITRGRNILVADFLARPENFTHLMFIDADVEFKSDDVARLMMHDKDVVVGAYPTKALPASYAINIKGVEMEGDLLKVHDAGTGFMMIKREVFEKMKRPEWKVRSHLWGDEDGSSELTDFQKKFNDNYYTFFDVMPEGDDDVWKYLKQAAKGNVGKEAAKSLQDRLLKEPRRYLSEDYLFCRRWQEMGGEVFLDTEISLTHYGTYGFFAGKPKDHLEKVNVETSR